MIDGHESRLELNLLQYINDPVAEWCVLIDTTKLVTSKTVKKEKNRKGQMTEHICEYICNLLQ